MAHTTNRIYIDTSVTPHIGVSIADIQAVLGLSNNDIGGLITQGVAQGKINKWAKYKPIHYPGKYELSDADFRGRPIDTNDHSLVYGLKVTSQVSLIDPDEFHAATWEYEGYPNATGLSGTSMYRFLDFNGYNKNAVPNLYGLIPSSSLFYIGTTVAICTGHSVVNEGFRVNNTDGVDLARYVVDGLKLTDEQLMARLAQCYPAILIGNYLTAVGVYNSTSGAVDYGTIVRANGSSWVVANPNWCLDLTKRDASGNAPWTADTSTVATLVLVYTASANPYMITGDATTDITQYWIDLSEERLWTARVFPLPGATGVTIEITRYESGFLVTPREVVSCTTSTVTIGFDITYHGVETSPTGTASITAKVGIGGTEPVKPLLLRGATATTATVTFNASEFDMAMFMPNTDYTIVVNTVSTPDGATGYGQFTFRPS